MALPSSPNAISFSAIQTEFGRGGANPITLTEYYKGGTYVKSWDTAPNVPASGRIRCSDFHGAAAVNFTASASPNPANLYSDLNASNTWDLGPVYFSTGTTVTPSGGTAPYTYSWTKLSGDLDMEQATGASNVFGYWFPAEGSYSGNFRCTVTDANNNQITVDVSSTISEYIA